MERNGKSGETVGRDRERDRDLGGACRYSRRLTRLMDKPLWGLKVLKFDGAIAPRVLRFDAPPARGLWWAPYIYRRRPLMIKPNNRAFARGKNIQPPCGRRKCISPLVAGATTLPGGKHVTGFAGRLRLLTNPVPLPPPQFGWSIKRKALLWAGLGLTLTNLHILCRMCTVAL